MTRKILAASAALAVYLVVIPLLLRDSPYLLGVVTTASKDPRAPWHQALGDKRGSVLRS